MQISDAPGRSPKVFAESAMGSYVRSIPQTTADPAAASFDAGFPPQTFTDEGAGGTPPDGRDFNGILRFLSAWTRWQSAGSPAIYDGAFQTAIGGYPRDSIVRSATTAGLFWVSLADNNMSNPDTGGANWARFQPGGRSAGLNAQGYWSKETDGNGGVIIEQWGTIFLPATGVNTSQASIVFPIEFLSATSVRLALTPAGSPNGVWDGMAMRVVGSVLVAGATIKGDTCAGTDPTGHVTQAVPVFWQAKGY